MTESSTARDMLRAATRGPNKEWIYRFLEQLEAKTGINLPAVVYDRNWNTPADKKIVRQGHNLLERTRGPGVDDLTGGIDDLTGDIIANISGFGEDNTATVKAILSKAAEETDTRIKALPSHVREAVLGETGGPCVTGPG